MGIILDLSHPIVWLFRHVWSDKAEFSFLQKKTVLHWLPVKFRICHKIAVISSKTIHNMGPAFLSNLINIKQCSRYNLRSIVGVILQDPTAKFKCTLGDISFTAAAPKIWNGLPDYIRKENDFDMFKRLIKTNYFKEANSDLS